MASELLSRSEARDAAFSACDIGLFVLDADRRLVDANDALRRLLGLDEIAIGESCWRALLGEDRDSEVCPAAAVLRDGQSHQSKFRHVVGDRPLVLSCVASPIRDQAGRVIGVAGALLDVTDATAYQRMPPKPTSAQARTAEQERRLRALEGVTHSLSFSLEREELEDKIVSGMTALVRADMYALYLSENYRNTLTYCAPPYLSPQSLERLEELARSTIEAFAEEGISYADVILKPHNTRLSEDEPVRSIESFLNVPITINGTMAGLLTVTSDTPEAFDQLDLSLLATLSNEAALAVDRMRMCRRNLQNERMAAVGETVATIAHYITNITSNLSGSRHVMDLAIQARDWARVERVWGVLRRTNLAVSQLVLNLLNYSKKREPVLEPTDPREVIEFVVEQCVDRAEQYGVEIELDIEGLPDEVLLDAGQIEHCLLNLVVNGIDVMPHGGSLKIRARYDSDAQQLRIDVSDEGPGIPPQDLKRIFEPFYSSKGSKGTGIGLAVSRKIAREHGGDLVVSSRENEGATFSIILPVKEAHSP